MSLSSKLFHFLLMAAAVLVGGAFVLAVVSVREEAVSTDQESVQESVSQDGSIYPYTLFGTLLSFNPNAGFRGGQDLEEQLADGWLSFMSDEKAFTAYLNELEKKFEEVLPWAEQTHFSSDRALVAAFVWNVIEPEANGEYRWDLTDLIVEYAGRANMSVVPSVQPFAAWDQDAAIEGCRAIDFAYYDYAAGVVNDKEAYEAFLRAAVDRYDGDGKNDMPGLLYPIEAWEIGNEYDGNCGGEYNQAENFAELVIDSARVIKQEDPEAIVLNGGNIKIDREEETFWRDAFSLGLGNAIDAFSIHYNQERGGIKSNSDEYERTLNFFNDLMEQYGGHKPIWLTEFGTFSGETIRPTPDGGQKTHTQSEQEQASWYFRYTIIGFELGVERYFIDLFGGDGSIGGSAMFNDMTDEPRLFFYTLQALGEHLQGFSSVEKLDEGQYLFEVGDQEIYAIWAGDPPDGLSGALSIVNLTGDETVIDVADLDYDEENPILVLL